MKKTWRTLQGHTFSRRNMYCYILKPVFHDPKCNVLLSHIAERSQLKNPHTMWLRQYNFLEKAKLWRQLKKKKNQWLRSNWWGEEKWFGEAGIFCSVKLLYDIIMIEMSLKMTEFKLTECTTMQMSQCKSWSLDDNDI